MRDESSYFIIHPSYFIIQKGVLCQEEQGLRRERSLQITNMGISLFSDL
jgi:hypothetical protein